MKTSPEDVTVLLVGGGSIIVPDKLSGVANIIRPPFFGVANAVGAAMAKGLLEHLNGTATQPRAPVTADPANLTAADHMAAN